MRSLPPGCYFAILAFVASLVVCRVTGFWASESGGLASLGISLMAAGIGLVMGGLGEWAEAPHDPNSGHENPS